MRSIQEWAEWVYIYCTDFIINLANLTGLSYYEINAFLFCFLYPFITMILVICYLYLNFQVQIVKRKLKE